MGGPADLENLSEGRKSLMSGRLTFWLALAALSISIGHIIYSVWRDHINDGVGLLGV